MISNIIPFFRKIEAFTKFRHLNKKCNAAFELYIKFVAFDNDKKLNSYTLENV